MLIGTNTFFSGAEADAFELLDISFADGGAPLGPNPPTGGTFAATGGHSTFSMVSLPAVPGRL